MGKASTPDDRFVNFIGWLKLSLLNGKRVRPQVNFKKEDITIPNDTIAHIINNYTKNGDTLEEGVRNLRRCLEIIFTKLNLYRLIKPDTELFEKDVSFTVQFPITITSEIVDKLIVKNESEDNSVWKNWYM